MTVLNFRRDDAPERAAPSRGAGASASKQQLLGLNFEPLAPAQAARAIAERSPQAPFAYVVTPNIDHLVRVLGDRRELLPIYEAAWLRLCDSRVLRLLARWRGVALSLVTGSDLVARLFDHFIRPSDPITIIGCSADAVRAVCDAYGVLRVSHYVPPMNFIAQPAAVEACVAFVLAHPARYVLLAVGSPQQEILASKIAASGRAVGVGLCIGASLNFLAGIEQRAPRWIQWCCLEWLYRLCRDPQRLWWRYLVRCPRIFFLLWRAKKLPDPVA